jgi:putative nucleotidyltransferase with HDIG domain
MRTRAIASMESVVLLALSAALFTTLIVRAELFVAPLAARIGEPAPVTVRMPSTFALPREGEARIGHPRIARGVLVPDDRSGQRVERYEAERRPLRMDVLLGTFFAALFVFLILGTWLRTLSPGRGSLVRTQLGLVGLYLAFLALTKAMLLFTDLGAALAPVGALTLWTRVYLDRRTAFVVAVSLAALVAASIDFDSVTITTLAAQGMVPVLVARDKKRPSFFVVAGAVGGLAAAGTLAASRVLFVGYFDLGEELAEPGRSELVAALLGGGLAGIAAYTLLSAALLALGAVSRHRLLELTDLDHPLLRRMARDAPGSWEHARAMANLAEAATAAIRGDALLVRVGAYYHDLGKTIQPKFFVENLTQGEASPHQGLGPDLSVDAIKAHVVEGVEILRDGGIPEPVVEFAYTHHGTSVIEYFWHQNLSAGNPKQLDETFFRYPGMRPRTKETGILMLVDAVEAASRTIEPPERSQFEAMVQRIVFHKLRQGQLDECGLTLSDLRIVTAQLVETLCNVHHSRIRYPWQDRKGAPEALPAPAVATEEDMERAADLQEPPREDEAGPPADPP